MPERRYPPELLFRRHLGRSSVPDRKSQEEVNICAGLHPIEVSQLERGLRVRGSTPC
jgi:hypothetical protein